jgi:hypothetical protein
MIRPDPDENGMIPCNCCKNGWRKNMTTKKKYRCDKCNGTGKRTAPIGYRTQSEIEDSNFLETDQIETLIEMFEEMKKQPLIQEHPLCDEVYGYNMAIDAVIEKVRREII